MYDIDTEDRFAERRAKEDDPAMAECYMCFKEDDREAMNLVDGKYYCDKCYDEYRIDRINEMPRDVIFKYALNKENFAAILGFVVDNPEDLRAEIDGPVPSNRVWEGIVRSYLHDNLDEYDDLLKIMKAMEREAA